MFEERNIKWDGKYRQFVQVNTRSKKRVWSIRVDGNKVTTCWGQEGGKLQEAFEEYNGVNIGKSNEMSPASYALDRAKETCRKKVWEGYRERDLLTGEILDPVLEQKIDFDYLPLGLSFYKPDNTLSAAMLKKCTMGKAIYTRKRNGLAFILSKGPNGFVQLYSRRMLVSHDDEANTDLSWNDRFGHIIDRAWNIMPTSSIMLGELILDRDGIDDFKAVQSYTKSLTAQSIADQQELGYPIFYVWDIPFWYGKDLITKESIGSRIKMIQEVVPVHPHCSIIPIETYSFNSPEEAVTHAKLKDWEGFVVVDPEGVYGDKGYNFKGKPDRPGQFCGKLKPEFEDDVVVMWDPENGHGERSTKGRYENGIKSVAMYQYNKSGELVYISNVSSGLSEAMKRDLADPKFYPQVWKVGYSERFYISQGDDTNALIFAKFLETRSDKSPNECINPNL